MIGESSYYDDSFYLIKGSKTSLETLEASPLPEINIPERKKIINEKIKKWKEDIKKWEPYLGIVKEQSMTLENIMDYRQVAEPENNDQDAEEDKPVFNPNFSYKLFYQWQCKKMIDKSIEYFYIYEKK